MVPRRGLAARVRKSSKISMLSKTPSAHVYHSCVPHAMAERKAGARLETSSIATAAAKAAS